MEHGSLIWLSTLSLWRLIGVTVLQWRHSNEHVALCTAFCRSVYIRTHFLQQGKRYNYCANAQCALNSHAMQARRLPDLFLAFLISIVRETLILHTLYLLSKCVIITQELFFCSYNFYLLTLSFFFVNLLRFFVADSIESKKV